MLGTANQRPIEVDRAKWATSANVGEWYDMLSTALVDAGVAVSNPDYDPSAPRDSPKALQVHISKPDRIISFDESRVVLWIWRRTQASRRQLAQW